MRAAAADVATATATEQRPAKKSTEKEGERVPEGETEQHDR
jgi:hypothetical protein